MDASVMLEIIVKVVDKVAKLCSPEDKAKIQEILLQFFQNGKPPAESLGPKEDTELVYSYTASLYEGGKYQEALPGFWHLFTLNPTDPRYIFGFAACLHKLKRYKEAIENYFVAARVDPTNPVYWGHAADCYIQLGQLDMACVMLSKTIEIAGDDPKHAALKNQASLIRQSLRPQSEEVGSETVENPVSSEANK